MKSHLFSAFETMAHEILQLDINQISPTLTPKSQINHSIFPDYVVTSYDELLFGGALFSCDPAQIYHYQERFYSNFLVLFSEQAQEFCVIGPFLLEEDEGVPSAVVLAEQGLPLSLETELASFYMQLPLLTRDKLWSFVFTLFLTLYHKVHSPDSWIAVDYHRPHSTTASPLPVYEQDKLLARADMLEKRYDGENIFLSHVARGDYESAVSVLSVSFVLVRTPHKLRNDKNLLIVLNTLLRKAVEINHIHPLYLDRISSEIAIQIEELTTLDSISGFRYSMLKNYCDLVNRYSLSDYSPHIRKALKYLTIHFAEDCSLETVAGYLDLSPNYLSAQFNAELGMGIPQYLTQLRIRESESLLRNSTLSVERISFAVGFNDPNYFTRKFREQQGMTPTQYRKT